MKKKAKSKRRSATPAEEARWQKAVDEETRPQVVAANKRMVRASLTAKKKS